MSMYSICSSAVYIVEVGCSRNCLTGQVALLSRFRPRTFQEARSSGESKIETRNMLNRLQWGPRGQAFFSFSFSLFPHPFHRLTLTWSEKRIWKDNIEQPGHMVDMRKCSEVEDLIWNKRLKGFLGAKLYGVEIGLFSILYFAFAMVQSYIPWCTMPSTIEDGKTHETPNQYPLI